MNKTMGKYISSFKLILIWIHWFWTSFDYMMHFVICLYIAYLWFYVCILFSNLYLWTINRCKQRLCTRKHAHIGHSEEITTKSLQSLRRSAKSHFTLLTCSYSEWFISIAMGQWLSQMQLRGPEYHYPTIRDSWYWSLLMYICNYWSVFSCIKLYSIKVLKNFLIFGRDKLTWIQLDLAMYDPDINCDMLLVGTGNGRASHPRLGNSVIILNLSMDV